MKLSNIATRHCPFQPNIIWIQLKWWSTYRLVNRHRNSSVWEMCFMINRRKGSHEPKRKKCLMIMQPIVCESVMANGESQKWKIRHKSNRLYTFLRRLAYIKNWYKEWQCHSICVRRGCVSFCSILACRRCCHFHRECTVYVTGKENLTLMMWCALSHLTSNISKVLCMFFERNCAIFLLFAIPIFEFVLHTVFFYLISSPAYFSLFLVHCSNLCETLQRFAFIIVDSHISFGYLISHNKMLRSCHTKTFLSHRTFGDSI